MKIVALEEHFATLEVMDAWKSVDPTWANRPEAWFYQNPP